MRPWIITEQDRFGHWADVVTILAPSADAAAQSWIATGTRHPFRVRGAGRNRRS